MENQMDIVANYYSVKDRVKNVITKVVPPSDWKVFSYKAEPASEGQRIRVNEMRRQETVNNLRTDLNYNIKRVDALRTKVFDLEDTLLELIKLKTEINTLETPTKPCILTYDDYDTIINRLRSDILQSIRSHSLDSFETIEKERVCHYVHAACDGLDTEISETLAARQELADEYSSQFDFIEEDDSGESKDC